MVDPWPGSFANVTVQSRLSMYSPPPKLGEATLETLEDGTVMLSRLQMLSGNRVSQFANVFDKRWICQK